MVILICDDNREDVLLLQKMLRKKIAEEKDRAEQRYIELIPLTSGQLLTYTFQKNEMYILFQELVFKKENIDGLHLAEKIREISMNLAIVFISYHLEFMPYLLKGSVMPTGFLRKPLNYLEFSEIFDNILRLYENQINEDNVFVLNLNNDTLRLRYSQILYFEALQKKISLHTISRRYSFYSTLISIENEVGNHHFVRCHNSFIINKDKVIDISFTDMIVTMENRAVIPISRTFKQNVRNVFSDN